jgi:hypothetical protein
MLLLPIVEVFRAGDLHSIAQVTEAARHVCLHQDVTRIQVPVTDTRFHLVWKQENIRPVNQSNQTFVTLSIPCMYCHNSMYLFTNSCTDMLGHA